MLSLLALALVTSMFVTSELIGQTTAGGMEKPSVIQLDSCTRVPRIQIKDWVGEKIAIVPSRLGRGSTRWTFSERKGGFASPVDSVISGKLGTIMTVNKTNMGYEFGIRLDSGDALYGGEDVLREVALLRDLDSARARWLGDTIWYSNDYLSRVDDDGVEQDIPFLRYSQLSVKDIGAGSTLLVVRFYVVLPDGSEAYFDTNVSLSNVVDPEIICGTLAFLEYDPRKKFKWSAKIWEAIETGNIIIGMTPVQVRMSWGEPENIDRTLVSSGNREVWTYRMAGNFILMEFRNGILSEVQ